MRAFRPVERLIALWALMGGALLLLIVVVTAINAAGFSLNTLARLAGGTVPGLPGYEDAVTLLVGAAALAMFPYCQLHGGHAVVDVFMQRAPRWANRFVFRLSGLLTIAVALGLAFMLVQGVAQLRADRVETAVLGWPVWPFAATAIASCLLWAVAAAMRLASGEEA